MDRVHWRQAAFRAAARARLSTRRAPLVVGALACTAGLAVAGSIWISYAPEAPAHLSASAGSSVPQWDLDSAEAAISQGQLVLAQLEPDAPTNADAPTLAEVIDLPIRRVATTRITLPTDVDDAGAAALPEDIAERPDVVPAREPAREPVPDLEALLAQAPSAMFPAPAASAPVTYASLPRAAVPERFALRPPRLPLVARLEAPPPLAGDVSLWPTTEPDGVVTEPDAPEEGDAAEETALIANALPPARPEGLPLPEPRSESEAPPPAASVSVDETPARAPTRTLAALLRAVVQGDALSGVTMAADGSTPTGCLPEPLREILADVARTFGTVTLVSTEILNTGNHYAGSARHRFHTDCEAVDFRVEANAAGVVRWLRGRPNVGGVAAYRNGVIHVDLDRAVAARLRLEAASR